MKLYNKTELIYKDNIIFILMNSENIS